MADTQNRPFLILVPGMCCVGSLVFKPLVSELKSLGWSQDGLLVVDNSSVDAPAKGVSLKPNGLDVDITNLQQILTRLIEVEGHDVLIVAHSYGGTPSISAAEGFWKHQRQTNKQRGGVTRVALISGALTSPGGTVAGERMAWQSANNVPLDAGKTFEVDGEHYLDPTGFDTFWYNDIDESEWKNYTLKPSAMSTVLTPVKQDLDPRNWRLAYMVLTELDTAMADSYQRQLIREAQDRGAEVDSTSLKSGHFAQISHAREVAEWILSLA